MLNLLRGLGTRIGEMHPQLFMRNFTTPSVSKEIEADGPILLTWTGPLNILFPGDLFYLIVAFRNEMSYL